MQLCCNFLHRLFLDLNVGTKFVLQVAHPSFTEEGFKGRMLQGLLDKGQGVKLQKLSGLSQIGPLCVQKLLEAVYLSLFDFVFLLR